MTLILNGIVCRNTPRRINKDITETDDGHLFGGILVSLLQDAANATLRSEILRRNCV